MVVFIIYLIGVAVGGLFSIMLYTLLSEYQRLRDFERELNVSEEQIIVTMSVFWPLTMLLIVVLSIGFSVHSMYAIFKNLFKMYKRKNK